MKTNNRHCERSEAIQSREAAPGLLRRHAPRNDGLVLGLLAALLLATPAAAGPRSIADCEAIQQADAYNRCLASFGPTRGHRGASYPGLASEPPRGKGGHGAYRRPRGLAGYGVAVSHTRGGRVRMEFTPGRR